MDTSIFNDQRYLADLSLALTPGIGPQFFNKLRQTGFSAVHVYDMSMDQLKALGLNKTVQKHVLASKLNQPNKDVERTLKWAEENNHHLITPSQSDYPSQLKNIASPPPLLMVKGQLNALQLNQLAMVGSRYPTAFGKKAAYEFAYELSEMGLVITSGLAKGIDGAAHQGALDAGGATIAVLGSGLNNVYPKNHVALSEAICEKGALISEFHLNAPPVAGHFPRRNRIVSGLSLGCLVVEATLKSGSLITARQALEQNREVMAIPGPINNPQACGCHHLIRQGAILIESPAQVVNELALQVEVVSKQQRQQVSNQVTDPKQKALLKSLDYSGANLDEIISRTELQISELSALLMGLELEGLIRQEQGLYMLS
jgi:DNA processing protein